MRAQPFFPSIVTAASQISPVSGWPEGACALACVPGSLPSWKGVPRSQSQCGFRCLRGDQQELIDAAVSAEPVKAPTGVKIDVTATRDMLTLNVVTAKQEASAEYYPLDDDSIRNAAEQKLVPLSDGVSLTTERADISDTLPKEVKGVLKLSGGRAYTFDVPVGPAVANSSRSDEPRFLLAVVLAFAGGIILNLMPCVFPVLFLKALALVGSAEESRVRQRLHGSAYTLGILCSFWIVVGVLLSLRSLGKQAGWGFQLQSPVFVVAMTCLLFYGTLPCWHVRSWTDVDQRWRWSRS